MIYAISQDYVLFHEPLILAFIFSSYLCDNLSMHSNIFHEKQTFGVKGFPINYSLAKLTLNVGSFY